MACCPCRATPRRPLDCCLASRTSCAATVHTDHIGSCRQNSRAWNRNKIHQCQRRTLYWIALDSVDGETAWSAAVLGSVANVPALRPDDMKWKMDHFPLRCRSRKLSRTGHSQLLLVEFAWEAVQLRASSPWQRSALPRYLEQIYLARELPPATCWSNRCTWWWTCFLDPFRAGDPQDQSLCDATRCSLLRLDGIGQLTCWSSFGFSGKRHIAWRSHRSLHQLNSRSTERSPEWWNLKLKLEWLKMPFAVMKDMSNVIYTLQKPTLFLVLSRPKCPARLSEWPAASTLLCASRS